MQPVARLLAALAVAGAVAVPTTTTAAAQCGPRLGDYEGYRLRRVSLESPLALPRAFMPFLPGMQVDLPPAGSPLRAEVVNETLRRLDRAVQEAPVLLQTPAAVTVTAVYIDHCDDEAREVDLVFSVFTTRLSAPSAFSRNPDSARRDPATAAGLTSAGPRLSLEPEVNYNEADRLVGGARAAFTVPAWGLRVAGEGAASDRFTNAAINLSGVRDVEHPLLWRGSFGAGYRFEERPMQGDELRQGYGFGWLAGETRPGVALGGPLRYGLQLEGGFQDSPLHSEGFATDAHYGAVKLLAGTAGGRGPHDYTVSTGVALGATGAGPAWYKLLFDGTYSLRVSPRTAFFDHRALDLESRVTSGWLGPVGDQRPPQNERFFGGVRPRSFTEIPDWTLRSAPLMRGYPNDRLFAQLAGDPSGRERFASVNLTAALTAWRRPLLPKEVYANPAFLLAMDQQKGTASQYLRVYHESLDPALRDADAAARDANVSLGVIAQRLAGATVPDTLSDALGLCTESVDQSRGTLQEARSKRTFGVLVRTATPGSLDVVLRDCEAVLDGGLADPELRASLEAVRRQRAVIDDVLENRVNHALADRRAAEDFGPVDRALTAFIHDINLVSLDPVLTFDMAYVGPAVQGTFIRYSVGGGLRLTLGSIASITIGYAANLNRASGEPRGAVFFDLKFADLIR